MAYLIARNQESKFNNLKLALLFNRIDIVQTDIFSGDQDFKLDQKIELLELALVQNNPEFIEMILETAVDLSTFLNKKRLYYLYNAKIV